MSPLLTKQTQSLRAPLPFPILDSSGFFVTTESGKGFIQILASFFKIRRATLLIPSSWELLIFPFSSETKQKVPSRQEESNFHGLKFLFRREKDFLHFEFLGKSNIIIIFFNRLQ
jgi:hypothetical protein